MSRIYSCGGLCNNGYRKTEDTHTVVHGKYKYVVKSTRETHFGYSKVTTWIERILNKEDDAMLKYDGMHENESYSFHLLHDISGEALTHIMNTAEQHFARKATA